VSKCKKQAYPKKKRRIRARRLRGKKGIKRRREKRRKNFAPRIRRAT